MRVDFTLAKLCGLSTDRVTHIELEQQGSGYVVAMRAHDELLASQTFDTPDEAVRVAEIAAEVRGLRLVVR